MKKVYVIKDRGEGKKSIWIPIGAAFVNKDGSLNVVLDALPIGGRMHIRDAVNGQAEGEAGPELADG